jgi:hypothetical protein
MWGEVTIAAKVKNPNDLIRKKRKKKEKKKKKKEKKTSIG